MFCSRAFETAGSYLTCFGAEPLKLRARSLSLVCLLAVICRGFETTSSHLPCLVTEALKLRVSCVFCNRDFETQCWFLRCFETESETQGSYLLCCGRAPEKIRASGIELMTDYLS